MAKISVIVPVYKVESYIHRCVDSILAQTFTDFELILVNDGSPDNCGIICDEYAMKDSRVHVIHQENRGVSVARNVGLNWVFSNSSSQWINFVDSDDWVHPQMLEQLYRAVLEHDVKVGVCGHYETDRVFLWNSDSDFSSKTWTPEQYYVKHNVNATVLWGKLYDKNCFKTIRCPVDMIHEDESVTHRILFAYEKIAVIDNPMYAYYINPQGITKSEWSIKRLDALEAIEQQIAFFRKNGFEAAFCLKEKIYIIDLTIGIRRIEQMESSDNVRVVKKLRRKLGKHLRRYAEYRPFINENMWFYEMAYPKLMWVYWTVSAQISKMKNGWK